MVTERVMGGEGALGDVSHGVGRLGERGRRLSRGEGWV